MSQKQFHQACQRLDGETDAALGEYFTLTRSLKDLANTESRQTVAVGLKGIGKSSSFRYLTSFDSAVDVAVPINPDSHTLSLQNPDLNYAACRKQFEYDLVIEALRAIDQRASSLAGRVDKNLLTEARKHVRSFLDSVKSAAGRITSLGGSILGCGFTVSRGEARTLVGLIPDKEVKDAQQTLRRICATGLKVRIVVDDPELVFSASQRLDTHLVGGFCLAAMRLSAGIKGFKVIGFVKTHVYHPVRDRIEDFSKYPEHMARLSWTHEELEHLIAGRLRWAGLRWTEVFEARREEDARTLVRNMMSSLRNGPRDLLRWCDLAIEKAAGQKVENRQIEDTRERASRDAFKEMEAAHAERYEKLGAVVRAVFSTAPEREFTPVELRLHIQNLMVKDEKFRPLLTLDWMQREHSDTLPQLLFEVGAVAFRRGSGIVLPYQPEYELPMFEAAERVMLARPLVPAVRTL